MSILDLKIHMLADSIISCATANSQSETEQYECGALHVHVYLHVFTKKSDSSDVIECGDHTGSYWT